RTCNNACSMQWDDLRVFLAVHRLGSHQRAARQLRVDPTTVARRLAALESALGTRLLARTPDRVELTPAGLELLPRAERIETEALAAERALAAADDRLEGSVRVTATDGVVHYLLLPALGAFRCEHPQVTLELRIETRVLDLSRREADVAVRLARPKQPALVARRLGSLRWSLFASEAYLERRGTPRSLGALAGHDFVGYDAALDLPETRWLERAVREPRYVVRATSTTAQALACAEGHGIALLPSFVAPREPHLRRLLPRLVGPEREAWGVLHSDLKTNARASAFLSFLARLVLDVSS
ncbi:MAG TPA: LysR family transcriptional regulator, partial [Polyangiaceae bacterium]|nr:LysR family transcriptional regulator [Polyangiaceae bacterium]